MADKLIRNFTTTTTSPAADDYLALDGTTNNTRKILADKFATSDELAESTGTKLVGPAISFETNDYLEVADSDKLSFTSTSDLGDSSGVWTATTNSPAITDGTGTLNDNYKITTTGTVAQGASTLSIIDGVSATAGQVVYYDGSVWRLKDSDDLPFSVSGWVKPTDSLVLTICGKFGTSADTREWVFLIDNNDKLKLSLRDVSGNVQQLLSDSALTTYDGQWVHVACTYGGAGPNSTSPFSSAASSEMNFFVNGVSISGSSQPSGTYTGMSNTSQAVQIMRNSNTYSDGEVKQVTLHNRELSAAEVEDVYRHGQLGAADSYGGAFGGVYTSDFTGDSTDGYTASGASIDATQTIGSDSDNLKVTIDGGAGVHQISDTITGMTVGKRFRVSVDVYVPNGNGLVNQVALKDSTSGIYEIITPSAYDQWVNISTEGISANTTLQIRMADDGSTSFTGNSTDYIGIRNITVTQIGTLADFRAENYNEAGGNLYDISDNAFVGTSANLPTLVGGTKHIQASSLNLTGIPTSSAGLSAGEVWSNSGVLTVV